MYDVKVLIIYKEKIMYIKTENQYNVKYKTLPAMDVKKVNITGLIEPLDIPH